LRATFSVEGGGPGEKPGTVSDDLKGGPGGKGVRKQMGGLELFRGDAVESADWGPLRVRGKAMASCTRPSQLETKEK